MSLVTEVSSLDVGKALGQAVEKLEIARLGQSFAVHSVASGSIALTNSLGFKILEHIRQGLTVPDVCRALSADTAEGIPDIDACKLVVSDIVENWRRAGLFETAPADFPRPPREKTGAVSKVLNFGSAKGRVRLELDDEELSHELEELLACFPSEINDDQAAVVLRCVADLQEGVALSLDGKPIWSRTDQDEARFLLLKEAAQVLCGATDVGAMLHGAAVSGSKDTAMLLLGQSGSGKSTLCQGLVASGCGFLADDHIPLSVDGKAVLAFPTAAAVKSGAMPLPEIQDVLLRHPGPPSSRFGVTYLSVPAGAPAGSRMPICAVVLPEYSRDAEFALEEISPEAAFAASISSGARPCRYDPKILPVASLCNSVPFYRLRFSASEQSVPACRRLLAQ